MKWPGPLVGGITQSLISKFLECPYRFYFYAMLGLEEPRVPNPNLIWGNGMHRGLELLIKDPRRHKDWDKETWSSLDQEITRYFREEYPDAPVTFPFSVQQMIRLYNDGFKEEHPDGIDTERHFVIHHKTRSGCEVTLRGKMDGLTKDKTTLIEHKCKGKIDPLQTRRETPLDLQCGLYCYASGARHIIYDLIKIPDTQYSLPQRRVHQTTKDFIKDIYFQRSWNDYPIVSNKAKWISQISGITLTDEYLYEEFIPFCLDPLIDRICRWYDHVSQPGFDPDNPKFYNDIFYRTPIRHFDPSKTEYYKCNYWNVLVGEMDLSCCVPINSFYKELDEA